MIHFAYPAAFFLLIVPFIVRRFLPPVKGLHGDALYVPFWEEIFTVNGKNKNSGLSGASAKNNKKIWILWAVWILSVAAAARPQWIGEPIKIKDYGRDIMLVLDISTSMREPDFVLNRRRIDRLTAVKLTAENFIKRRTNDRIGLVLFGTRAYLQSPITFDRQSVIDTIKTMDAGMAGNSTSIGDALGLALKNIRKGGDKGEKIIILLTDGENNDGSLSMAQAINLAYNEKIKIYTIGVGTKNAFVDSLFGISVSQSVGGVDEEGLKQLAEKTKGTYFRAEDTQQLQKIYNEIDKMEPSANEDQFTREVRDLFHIPLSLALMLSFVALFLKRKEI